MSETFMELTAAEAAALVNLPQRKVWAEVDRVLELASPPRFSLDAVVYLKALAELDPLEPSVEGRKLFFAHIRTALAAKTTPEDEIPVLAEGGPFRFKLRAIVDAIWERRTSFDNWKAARVNVEATILGGEPVFRGSRLSVRHIGQLASRESIATILEDYPYLEADDVIFARWYNKAYPRLGRPRESA